MVIVWVISFISLTINSLVELCHVLKWVAIFASRRIRLNLLVII